MKTGDMVRYVGTEVFAHVDQDGIYKVLSADGRRIELDNGSDGYLYDSGDFLLVKAAPAPSLTDPPCIGDLRALRFNAGKPELFYPDMFPLALAEVARTLEYGTKRPENAYPRFNWCKGAPFLELYSCARRHMLAWMRGERHDADAKKQGFEINNLAFTIGNLMRLLEQELSGKASLDDRYKSEVEL